MHPVLLSASLAFVACAVLTAACKVIAHRVGAVAAPRKDRWHQGPTALLGGVGVSLAVLLAASVSDIHSSAAWSLLGASMVLGLVGLFDDLRPLKPQSKFVAQILAAAFLVFMGHQLRLTGVPLFDIVLTLLWLVGITNAFNLLDNMDGLAAGVSAITLGFRLIFFLNDGNMEGAVLCAVFAGASLGFLVHNFNPASIFMGDAGSLFLGFAAGGISLVGGYPYAKSTVSVLLFPVLILLVPIFDTTFVTAARILAGRPVSVGGRDHTSHRLVALGLSERQAVLFLYAVAAAAGGVALFVYREGASYGVLAVALLVIGMLIFAGYLSHLRVYPEGEVPAGRFVSLVSDFMYKRQVAAISIDLVLIVLAYYTAYLLRFEHSFSVEEGLFLQSLPVVLGCQLSALALMRVYQGVWRYTSLADLIRLSQAIVAGTAAAVIALVFLYRFQGYSRAVFVVDAVFLLVFLGGSRLSLRALAELIRPRSSRSRRALIYGAGDGGVLALREIRNNPRLELVPIGFLDDDRSKHRTLIHGMPVLGGPDRLEELVSEHSVSDVVIASQKIDQDVAAALALACAQLGVRLTRASLHVQ